MLTFPPGMLFEIVCNAFLLQRNGRKIRTDLLMVKSNGQLVTNYDTDL